MTWARRDASLTLRNATFRDQIATLSAAINQIPKEDIEGEDVRQQRRTRRIVQAVIAVLTVLVLLASVLAVVANIQRREAIHDRDVAISRQLISQSELLGDANPAISKLLSIAAWDINPSSDARYAMLAAAARPGIAVLSGPTGSTVASVAFSPDGKTLASASPDGKILAGGSGARSPRTFRSPSVMRSVSWRVAGRTQQQPAPRSPTVPACTELRGARLSGVRRSVRVRPRRP